MPRGKRYFVPGQTYHLTHRCHGREFLLKFKRDRKAYREMMRDRLKEHDVSLLSYCITSNHVHLLLKPRQESDDSVIGCFMQTLEGDFAQFYNRRKRRENSFWGDRYHATMVDSGEYLWRCLVYVDLNMVRAGVVEHPKEWDWTAYNELVGARQRYLVLDTPRLLECLGEASLGSFRANYAESIYQALRQGAIEREGTWTEALAVGSEAYVAEVGGKIPNRMKVATQNEGPEKELWTVRERRDAYS